MTQSTGRSATLDDFLAIPEEERFHELIDGELVRKADPSGEHGDTQAGVVAAIAPPFRRRSGRGGPGGWWIVTEVEVLLDGSIARPDVAGWRREHCPERPSGYPVKIRPDWTCEVISPSRPNHDTVKKRRLYHRAGIPHYWLADNRDGTLTVMRWSEDGYVTVLAAERHEVVRAEPFDQIEIFVGSLFGDDEPDPGV